MNARLLVCAVMLLGGCSFSETIKSDTLTYDEYKEAYPGFPIHDAVPDPFAGVVM